MLIQLPVNERNWSVY